MKWSSFFHRKQTQAPSVPVLNEAIFHATCDAALNHIIVTDIEGIILYANDAAEATTGFSREEMYGHTPRLWGRQMDRSVYEELWHTIKTQKKPFVGQLTNKRKNGDLYIASARISPLFSSDRTLVGFVGIEHDVTEFIRAKQSAEFHMNTVTKQYKEMVKTKTAMMNLLEDAKDLEEQLKREKASVEVKVVERTRELQTEQAWLATTLLSLPVGCILVDANDQLYSCNRVAKSILGISGRPKNLTDLEHGLTARLGLPSLLTQSRLAQQPVHFEALQFGTSVLRIDIAPIQLENQSTQMGSVMLIEDITERKVLERSKDEFFSIASHELRTPLTAIRGNTSMILDYYKESLSDPDFKEMVTDIHESSIRLIHIVNDFLQVGRLEQHKLAFKNSAFALDDLVADALKEFQVTSSRRKLYLHTQMPDEKMPFVFGDPDRCREVLINLVGNSMKYSESGGVTVCVSRSGRFIRVDVADTGRGIPPENQALLFRKFQQAGSSLFTRDATKGTGLGLYISKLMIEGMGGKIWLVTSEEGKGSTFAFTMPIDRQQSQSV